MDELIKFLLEGNTSPKFKNRMEFYKWYDKEVKAGRGNEVLRFIIDLAVPLNTIKKPLYHLSLHKSHSKLWYPRSGLDFNNFDLDRKDTLHDKRYLELAPERICVSDSLEGCFEAINQTVGDHLNDTTFKNIKEWPDVVDVDMYVYQPVVTHDIKVLTPETLCDNYLVFDAHYTREYGIISPVLMKYKGKITVRITPNVPDEEYNRFYPYNDKNFPDEKSFAAPPFTIIYKDFK